MTATTLSRAAQVAAVHLRPINESRRRAGLEPLTEAHVALEFAAVAHMPVRVKGGTLPTGTNQAATDSMWGGIVTRLNATLPSNRPPIGAGRTWPAGSSKPTQAEADSMWMSIARNLNDEAGLATPPARSAR
jgi:hypothetical protein